MSPKKLATKPADLPWGRARRIVAQKYREIAEVAEVEDGAAINVCVGLCVLAGIAASDAICAAAAGERYSGTDHSAAADLLARHDAEAAKHLRTLIALKPAAHYGKNLLKESDRRAAMRASAALVEEATRRTT
ncbi:hypothetical protein [Pimelobacter simplex]|uniref:hypothetical protein n=1 Tax=Nocardioides simplex TaxID=2045 RepID=UPI001931AE91|nr:hypothetical protein [Pimelobacter simplex]